MGLIRKIAQCEKTEYSAKLVELVQGILGLLNEKELDAMQRDELSLLQMCIGVLADMVDNQVLQFFLTHSIIKRKFPQLVANLL